MQRAVTSKNMQIEIPDEESPLNQAPASTHYRTSANIEQPDKSNLVKPSPKAQVNFLVNPKDLTNPSPKENVSQIISSEQTARRKSSTELDVKTNAKVEVKESAKAEVQESGKVDLFGGLLAKIDESQETQAPGEELKKSLNFAKAGESKQSGGHHGLLDRMFSCCMHRDRTISYGSEVHVKGILALIL